MSQNTTQQVAVGKLYGCALDYAVAVAEGYLQDKDSWLFNATPDKFKSSNYQPSTNWSVCGGLIDKYAVNIRQTSSDRCSAFIWSHKDIPLAHYYGDSVTEAVCRCVVKFVVGDTVDIPVEFLK